MSGKLKLSDLLARGVELSDQDKEQLERQEREDEERDQRLAQLDRENRESKVKDKLTQLSEAGLDSPGLLKFVRSAYLSDDGGTAVEFAEFDDENRRVGEGKGLTATEFIDKFIEALPRDKDGKISLAEQAAAPPGGDPKPPEEREEDEQNKKSPDEQAAELEEELDLPWKREPAAAGTSGGDGQ